MAKATKGARRKWLIRLICGLEQTFMGLIYHNREDLPLDQPLGEDPPIDLDPGVLKASCGGPVEALGWSTGDEQLRVIKKT